ncbi:MAG: endolytic transglycosylase MltG [Armatimonadota bacterium]
MDDLELTTETPPPRHWLRWVWYGAGALAVLAIACGVAGYVTLFRPLHLSKPETVEVTRKSSFRYVAERLHARGLVPNAFTLQVYARLAGKSAKLKTGEYEVTNGQRPVDILDMLVNGRAKAYRVTIPEGKWASEVDAIFAAQWPDAAAQLPELIAQPALWQKKVHYPLEGKSLEGYLFPDTYRFTKGVTAEQIVAAMLERFNITCYAAYQQRDSADTRSLREVLVLASLVEAEAKVSKERPLIAGVYVNRLRRDMILQCDATVLYAHKQRLKRVLNKDLEIDSPYNTYRYAGLPPGPINNPGLSSFMAALKPEKSEYLYYVARGDGTHVFSRTLAEHNAAIHQIRGK